MTRSLLLLVAVLLCGCGLEPPRYFRDTVRDPLAEFNEITGLNVPRTAQVVSARDTHGGFMGDGELSIVLQVDEKIIDDLLGGRALRGEWRQGPVPDEISGHCMDTPKEWRDAMDDERIRYFAKDSEQTSIPWHNGRLVVIDPMNRRLILSSWDF